MIRRSGGAGLTLLRRLAALALALLLISFLIFSLTYLTPGSAERALLGNRPASPELVATIRAQHHLDEPFVVQYWYWLRGVFQLQLGESTRTQEPVVTAIGHGLPVTLQLIALAAALTVGIGLTLGVVAALRQGSALDRGVVSISLVGASSPIFVSSVLLLVLFGVKLGWFPVYGAGNPGLDRLRHLALPAFALSLIGIAYVLKTTRAVVTQALEREWVGFARARGVGRWRVLFVYVLRGSAIPIVTAVALSLVTITVGTVLVEVPFSINGLGALLQKSISNKDVPMIQGIALLMAAAVLLINLVVDLSYRVIDPRLRQVST